MTELKNIDFFVYICIDEKNLNTVKDISIFLKIDKPKIYQSIYRLCELNKISKLENTQPNEYYSNKMEEKQDLEKLKDNPEMVLDLFVKTMDRSRHVRNFLIKQVIEKDYVKEAKKEWKNISHEQKKEWARNNFFNEKNNIDVFLNACWLLKDTKDEKTMLEYVVKNIK